MGTLRSDWLVLIVRLVLGGFFVYAALDKIVQPAAFARIVYNYHLLPGSAINIFALILPWLELLCGMALILGTRVTSASVIVAGLTVVFIIAVSATVARGIKIDCGCFSTSPDGARKVGMPLLIEDTVLLLMAVYVWVCGAGRWALDRARR